MAILQLLLTILYFVFANSINTKFLRSVAKVFVLFASIQILLYLINIYNSNIITTETIILFNINILMFLVGIILYSNSHFIDIKNLSVNIALPEFNINFFLIFQILIIFLSIPYLIKYMFLLDLNRGLNSREIYFNYGSYYLFSNYYDWFFFTFTIRIYKYIACFQFASLIFKVKLNVKEIILIALSTVFIVIVTLIGQGRFDSLPLFTFSIGAALLIRSQSIKYFNKIIFLIFNQRNRLTFLD